jgi:hypothetical protein
MDAIVSENTASSVQPVASSGLNQYAQQPQHSSAPSGRPSSNRSTSTPANADNMASDAYATNEKLFPLLQKGLADANLTSYMNAAKKLISWMSRPDAFYTAARPRVRCRSFIL